jgi:hypothetical protein
MPTPDGREWLTPAAIIERQIQQVLKDYPSMMPSQMEDIRASLEEGFRSTGYQTEFKILRLYERIQESVRRGVFGPLVVPDAVDVDGNKIPTPAGQIGLLMRDATTADFLDMLDEDGIPLDAD